MRLPSKRPEAPFTAAPFCDTIKHINHALAPSQPSSHPEPIKEGQRDRFAFGLLAYQVSGEGLLNVSDVLTPGQLRECQNMEENQGLEQAPEKLMPEFEAPLINP
jgi:hypothetical protein